LAVTDSEVNEDPTAGPRHRGASGLAAPVMVSMLVLLALLITGPRFGMVWDEGYTVNRDRLLDTWFRRILDPASPGQWRLGFTKPELDRFWRFSRDGHPPFYALLGLAGWRLGHRWLPATEA
jgi:hypothetical protein